MKSSLILGILAFATWGMATPDLDGEADPPELSTVAARFEEAVADATRAHQVKDADLFLKYVAALENLKARLAKGGDLDLVIPVQEELDAVAGAPERLPALGKPASPELVNLRKLLEEGRRGLAQEKNERLEQILQAQQGVLGNLEGKLTRENRVREAMAVRAAKSALMHDTRFPKAAEKARQERAARELAAALENTKWAWSPVDPAKRRDGLFITFRPGAVFELSWHPERGRWRVVGESLVELDSQRWRTPTMLFFDDKVSTWEARLKGGEQVLTHGKRVGGVQP